MGIFTTEISVPSRMNSYFHIKTPIQLLLFFLKDRTFNQPHRLMDNSSLMCGSRGGGGGGGGDRGPDPPEKSQKYSIFLSILARIPANKPAFNVGPSSVRQRNGVSLAGR